MAKVDWSKINFSAEKLKQIKRIDNKKPVIYIGMGSCGLAAGAQATKDEFIAELKKINMDVEFVSVGCIGACFVEPIVDIKMPGKTRVSYAAVTAKKVADLVKMHMQEGQVVKESVIGQYMQDGDAPYSGVQAVSDYTFFKNQKRIVLNACGRVDPDSIDDFIVYDDGFKALANAIENSTPDKVFDEIKSSGLRGRGGAGFPTHMKWDACRKATSPDGKKYIIMNADEGDPGAFMDRSMMESVPLMCVEGMALMGFVIGAQQGYIYCRAEKPIAAKRVKDAIENARKAGFLGKNILGSGFDFDIEMRLGAGAFVCGEETAMLESIEGKRGMPRIKPPFPATYGLWGRPTVINNVETICVLPKILNMGGANYAKIGTEKSKGTKVFAVTGKITYPGLVEVPLGTTFRQIMEIAGGIPNGKKYKSAQIGGPSGGCIPMSLIDTSIDYESLKGVGAIMGSGGLVFMDEDTCMVDTARFFMSFIQEESCGKCIPCREGTRRMLETLEKLVNKPKNDEETLERMKSVIYLERLAGVIGSTALCGLGMSAPNPVLSTLKYFRDEYEAHLYEDRCPSHYCPGLSTYKIDPKKCTGCGLCKLNCPNNAILGEKKSTHIVVEDKCIKCGLCRQNCKFNAVNVD